jgi:hypothetical protein
MIVGQLYVFAGSSATDIFESWDVPGEGGAKLVQVWPVRRNIVPWPTDTLTDHDADQVAGSFFAAVEAIGRRSRGPKANG